MQPPRIRLAGGMAPESIESQRFLERAGAIGPATAEVIRQPDRLADVGSVKHRPGLG